jgi:hypothetical protein
VAAVRRLPLHQHGHSPQQLSPAQHPGFCSQNLHGCTIFSKTGSDEEVPIAAANILKTAIITLFGLFEYIYMPFGLRNSAQAFQRLMDNLFRGLDFCFTYMDDNLVASRNPEEHLLHLRQIFGILAANGLTLNAKKCKFAVPQLDFLGDHVSAAGLAPLAAHTEAIQSFPPPTDLKSLQRFLGMVNF